MLNRADRVGEGEGGEAERFGGGGEDEGECWWEGKEGEGRGVERDGRKVRDV